MAAASATEAARIASFWSMSTLSDIASVTTCLTMLFLVFERCSALDLDLITTASTYSIEYNVAIILEASRDDYNVD